MRSLKHCEPELKDRHDLDDGLYRVETPAFVAGFVIEGGVVTRCAPILRRRLSYWMRFAVFVTR
jgi:hypothetical protein